MKKSLRYAPIFKEEGQITPFQSSEDAWFWFAQCQQRRNNQVRRFKLTTDIIRPCEPDDIYRVVMRLHRQHYLHSKHLKVLATYGLAERPPDVRCNNERSDHRIWWEALEIMNNPLRGKKLFAVSMTSAQAVDFMTLNIKKYTNTFTTEFENRQAIVVFGNQNSLPWLRLLAPGFRHCFVVIEAQCGWIVLDPLSNIMTANSLAAISSSELRGWYESHGYRSLNVSIRPPRMKPAPWALFTCVEAVKRVLGIYSRRVHTPLQLYNYLINEKNP